MIITITVKDYELFNQLVEEIKIMIPPYPFTKPYIDYVDWRNCQVKLFCDGEYYHIFISMLKKYILEGIIKVESNLKFYPLAIQDNRFMIPQDDWLITIIPKSEE